MIPPGPEAGRLPIGIPAPEHRTGKQLPCHSYFHIIGRIESGQPFGQERQLFTNTSPGNPKTGRAGPLPRHLRKQTRSSRKTTETKKANLSGRTLLDHSGFACRQIRHGRTGGSGTPHRGPSDPGDGKGRFRQLHLSHIPMISRPSENARKRKDNRDEQGYSHHDLPERHAARLTPPHIHFKSPFPAGPESFPVRIAVHHSPENPRPFPLFRIDHIISSSFRFREDESGNKRIHLLFFKSTIF